MEHFLGYAIPGIPFGCTYALFAVGLVLTYQATGVFNFAFAAQAYASAYVYMYLTTRSGWPVWAAFMVSVVIMAPALGWILDFFLFRRIPNTNVLAKVVTGISLLIGIPQILIVFFGSQNLYHAPSVILQPTHIYFHLFGYSTVPITGTFLSNVIVTAVALLLLTVLVRFTALGLRMRAAVESRRLVQLEGVNATRVVNFAWMVSSLLAGIAGVLLAPEYAKLTTQAFVILLTAAIAAAAWGVMRSMPIAAGVGVLLGIVEFIAQGYLPSDNFLKTAVLPVLPIIVLAVALFLVPGMRNLEDIRDPLASVDPPTPPTAAASRSPKMDSIIRRLWWVVFAGFIVSMLTWIPTAWAFSFNEGIALGVIFLSITLITGLGGQLSLAQATLAGVGAFTAGQLAIHLGLNMLIGGIIGAVVAAVIAVVLAIFSLKLKGIGLALMTLAAALMFQTSIFKLRSVSQQKAGVTGITLTPKWVHFGLLNPSGKPFFILAMIVISVVVLGILAIRSGTIGRYLSAMRGSEMAAGGLGINTGWMRVLIFALSGGVAGIGGTLFAIQQGSISGSDFNTEFSLVFVVIVITTGVSTVEGAIQAGIGFTITEKLVSTYVPPRFGANSLVFVLFAFGALTYANHPEGILEFQRRKWTGKFDQLVFLRHGGEDGDAIEGEGRGGRGRQAEPASSLVGAATDTRRDHPWWVPLGEGDDAAASDPSGGAGGDAGSESGGGGGGDLG